MPGKSIKNWPKYHALRKKGHSKTSAARIANKKKGKSVAKKRKKSRSKKSRTKHHRTKKKGY